MKWINGLTKEEKQRRIYTHKTNWHEWFAWYPVVVDITKDQHKIKAWLEYVERKGKCIPLYSLSWIYEYRLLREN